MIGNWVAEICDVVINGRSAKPDQPKRGGVTIQELILRGTSHVRVDGTIYRVVVTKARKQEPAA